MTENKLYRALQEANEKKRRLAAPLLGFPGLKITRSTIKLAQQNYGEHFNVLKSIAENFHPDLIFPLMDLSVEANALGRYTLFPVEEPATVIKKEFTTEDLERIEKINVSFDTRIYGYVETVRLMKNLSQNILHGAYVTGPYTLAGLIMGSDEAALASIMNTEYLHRICNIVTKKILNYADLLINAGADVICILEPSAVMLGPDQFTEFSGNYVKEICNYFKDTGTAFVYHICGNTGHLTKHMANSGVDALSLDSPDTGVDLSEAAKQVPENVILIGNISPVRTMLFGTPQDVQKDVIDLLQKMNGCRNFILSTGCDLPQEVPPENINAFIKTGKSFPVE